MKNGTHEPDTAQRFFRTQRPGDARAELAQRKRDIDYELYSPWTDPTFFVDDFELEITEIQEATGEGKTAVEKAIFAYRRLADLPWLRAIQDTTRVLDLKRLIAIDNVIAELGPELSGEVLMVLDEFLVAMFTPKKANQPLPTPKAIAHRLRRFIAKLDERVGYDPEKRTRRNNPAGDFTLHDFTAGKRFGLTVECDNATHAAIREFRQQVAREHKLSEAEAAKLILTGRLEAQPKVTIFGYAPLTPEGDLVPGASIYFPGSGWTDAGGTEAFEDMVDGNPPRIVGLDEVAHHEVEGYVPSVNMRAYAAARDGVCVWPGCNRAAEHCQLDHRIPFQEGGATTPANLYSLCQKHHNVKTDRRAYYLPDLVTGDVVWLFPDGTYQLSEPEGFIGEQLNQCNPRWNTDLDTRQRERDKASSFYARGHKILDEFDRERDMEACKLAIGELEKEFGMKFPFQPPPPMIIHNAGFIDEAPEAVEDYEARLQRLIENDPYLKYGDSIY
ncbi:HNH endonuclease signature motif containing protein [Corynebacterium qintianiae]|uniref:HNH endonuclease signature motif containing protein n=1 Tax=Corynebacterium qintianiae TaxID=2709392 RepID=UPI0013EB1960|nr:HNH endonuclease signature motif containing protein [Corynebacterium qintianiae]